jgi:hypothetical protein
MNPMDYRQARQQITRRGWRRQLFRAHLVVFLIGIAAFFFWLRALPFSYPVYLVPPALWALLIIAHWFYTSSADAADAEMERLWDNLYNEPKRRDTRADFASGSDDLQQLRQVVEEELVREKVKRRRLLFRINVVAYLVVMLFGWIMIPILLGPFYTASAAMTIFALSFAGLMQLILHYMTIRLDTTEGEKALRERLLGRALHNMSADDAGLTVKAKRSLRLSDDGELLDADDLPDEKYKRAQS